MITADHGDLFGEFGQYGHPEGFVHPNLNQVPWVETTATDEETSVLSFDTENTRSTSKINCATSDISDPTVRC